MKDVTEMKNQNSDASGVRTTSIAQIPVNANTAAQLTVLSSQSPKVLTKQILLDDEGNMVKIPSAHLTRGNAEVVEIQSMQEFSELLQDLEDSQALVYGVPKGSLSQAKVVTKKAFSALSDTKDVITRSNDHFEWPSTAGIMMFDYDPDDTVLDQEAVLNVLYTACPAIKDVDHLWWTSSSSNIVNSNTGQQLSGLEGQRVYIMVKNASDIPRAAKVIEQQLWLAGHGHFKISKSGSLLERVTFDMSVYQPSLLDFASGASTTFPLDQNRGKPALIKGTNSVLDTRAFLSDLDAAKLKQVNICKLGVEAVAKNDATKVKGQYIAEMSQKLKANNNCLEDAVMPEIIEDVMSTRALPTYWPLHVWTGDALVEVTVETVLNNTFDYHESLCLDPIEPDYDGGRLVGKLYLDQKQPILHSFARGGQPFKLIDDVPEIFLTGCLSEATNMSLDILEQKGAAYTYGGALAAPKAGKLVNLSRIRMKLLLSSLIDFKGLKGYCDPTSDLAEGVMCEGADRNINPVKGFVDHPIIDASLRSFQKQGYDRTMQILGRFDHTKFDVIDQKLTDDEVFFHLARIYKPFTGFVLASADDKSVLMAAIFSAVVRQVLPTCPAFGFDAPMQGSGKTLLAETIAIITSGVKASAIAPGGTNYDEEFRKRLMALFLKGDKAYLFDNIVGIFDSPSLAAALTNEVYEDRILQHSKTVKTHVKALFMFTGNNLRFSGDMSRRVLTVRLRPDDANLAQREYKFDPTVEAKQTRKQIISSVLSLINHWKHCGQPRQPGTMTSFSEWDTLVRQPLALIAAQLPQSGLVDVLDVSVRQQDSSNDKEALIALLIALASGFGVNQRFKAGEVHNRYKVSDHNDVADAILAFRTRDQLQSSQKIGILLREFVDRNVDGLVLRSSKASGSLSYKVELTDDTHKLSIQLLSARPYDLIASNDSKLG